MLNYNTPLTAEESAFAAEHHHLLLSYLKKARLDFDEFYDIAVFGYIEYEQALFPGQAQSYELILAPGQEKR